MTSRKEKPQSLEAFAEAEAAAQFAENQEIARANRTLRVRVTEQETDLADVRKRLELYERLDSARLEPPKWLTPEKRTKEHVGIPCLAFADPHYGAVIKPEQVDFINAYNPQIAEQRLKKLFERTVILTRDYLAGVRYEGFQLFLLGDMFSGNIHEELRETNAVAIADAIVGLVEPMEAGINLLVETFGQVHLVCVVGNHGRTTKKPRAKNRAQDNYDGLFYRMLARDYRDDKRVTVDVSDAADARVQVYDTRFLATHGDQFKGGSGISSMLSPLLLGAHRKTRRAAAAGKPYDTMVMGHWHQSLWFPSKGLIVSGTVMGFDEYAFVGNMEPEPPQQTLWIATPEHGITFPMSVFVQDRVAEGW